ncbi:MAG TPA: hypothetical protein VD864_07535 [Nocardioides sp.]|nr:hypothetical protein [Nocardioides sp.]
MRRTLGTTLLLAALLTGCGEDATAPAADGDPPTRVATVVSGTAAGGDVAPRPTVLDDEAAIAEYAGQFRGPLVRDVIRAARAVAVPDGAHLVAAVVAVGCDVPPRVEVTGAGSDVSFLPAKVASPHPECFAPVTTVALAAVPQDGGE